jgi:hypothetical protein
MAHAADRCPVVRQDRVDRPAPSRIGGKGTHAKAPRREGKAGKWPKTSVVHKRQDKVTTCRAWRGQVADGNRFFDVTGFLPLFAPSRLGEREAFRPRAQALRSSSCPSSAWARTCSKLFLEAAGEAELRNREKRALAKAPRREGEADQGVRNVEIRMTREDSRMTRQERIADDAGVGRDPASRLHPQVVRPAWQTKKPWSRGPRLHGEQTGCRSNHPVLVVGSHLVRV